MKSNILKRLSEEKSLTTYHYKVILYLLGVKSATQTEVANALDVKKQNINKIFKELHSMDIIIKDRVEGRNIYWKSNPNPTFQEKGQIKLEL